MQKAKKNFMSCVVKQTAAIQWTFYTGVQQFVPYSFTGGFAFSADRLPRSVSPLSWVSECNWQKIVSTESPAGLNCLLWKPGIIETLLCLQQLLYANP